MSYAYQILQVSNIHTHKKHGFTISCSGSMTVNQGSAQQGELAAVIPCLRAVPHKSKQMFLIALDGKARTNSVGVKAQHIDLLRAASVIRVITAGLKRG